MTHVHVMLGDVATPPSVSLQNRGTLPSSRNSNMHLTPSKIFCRIGIAAAIVAIAAPSDAQPPADATLPYDAAKARMKEARAHSIYHGQQTPKGAYPFIVALIQSDAKDTEEDNYAGKYCVGSLIADHWVLTTAQCVATD